MSDNPSCPTAGSFGWNELVTTDVAGATQFYTQLFGWTTTAFGPDYTLLKKGDKDVGGLMKTPEDGMPAFWIGYIVVEDIEASSAKLKELGGEVMKGPFDVPKVGRLAMVKDPQGAGFALFQPQMA